MSDEELQLLITLDDPEGAPEEDIHHLQQGKVTFSQGDKTSTLSKLADTHPGPAGGSQQ